MAVEAMRGCGYRKVGGLYLVGGGLEAPCDRLPIPLTICQHCGQGVKQARGYAWLSAEFLGPHHVTGALVERHSETSASYEVKPCGELDVICVPRQRMMLQWVGGKFYTPESFTAEAAKLGVSKRLTNVPKDLKIGEDWVLLAHPEAVDCPDPVHTPQGETKDCETCGNHGKVPGIFYAFRPQRVELLLKQSDATVERIEQEKKRGVTVIAVPDDDADHVSGNAYSDLAARKKTQANAEMKARGLARFAEADGGGDE